MINPNEWYNGGLTFYLKKIIVVMEFTWDRNNLSENNSNAEFTSDYTEITI